MSSGSLETPGRPPGVTGGSDVPVGPHRDRAISGRAADWALYLAAGVLPLAIVAWLMHLWTADFAVPFAYGGDGLAVLAGVKGLFETGTTTTNPALGAPGVAQFYDIPGTDALHVLTLRILGLFGASPALSINLFYLASYPAVGVTTAFVARRLDLSRVTALGVAVLFAVLPYHYMRGEVHLFLSMYWIVPLLLLVAVWLDSPEPPLLGRPGTTGRRPFTVRDRRTIAALLICAAAGASGLYYLFFGCFFLAVVGLRAALRDRSIRAAGATAALILAAGLVFAAQLVPTVLYAAQHGKNPVAGARSSYEAETYGLRITQMVLPIDDHRVPTLARIRARYRAESTNGDNEANMAALGIVGVVGLLLSISAVLLDWPRSRRRRSGTPEGDESVSLGLLGVLTVSGILLGTVSGFGALIAGFVSPQIRAYDRISVFIALFAFVTLGVLADRLIRRRTDRTWRLAAPMAVAIVVLVGVLDQTPADLRPDVASSAEWAADVAFGRDVEGTVPSGASVFQLPYMPFPESWPIYGMTGYDPFRGYTHTSGLRWSFGAVNGRPDAAWQEATAELPTAAMIQRLRASGFSAVWVQLNGYEDGGAAIRRELDDVLGPPVLTRSDGVVALWRL